MAVADPYVVSLVGYLPPARYDGLPWTAVEVYEAPGPTGDAAGVWNLIDTQPLAPVDADPSKPAIRDVTTSAATLATGWYRLVFRDAASAQSEPTDPERSSTEPGVLPLPPTPDEIRNASPLLRAKFPVPPSDPFAPADLRNMVYQATAMVQSITWRLIDPTLGDLSPEGETSEAVPNGMVPIAVRAIALMAERLKVTSDPAFAEQVATGRRLRGFSAGPYSESYFAPGEFARRGAQTGRPAVDQDDALDAALWALMTEDARDYFVWRATGVAPPTGVASVFDYRRQSIGYVAGGPGFPYDGYGRGGPDGF